MAEINYNASGRKRKPLSDITKAKLRLAAYNQWNNKSNFEIITLDTGV